MNLDLWLFAITKIYIVKQSKNVISKFKANIKQANTESYILCYIGRDKKSKCVQMPTTKFFFYWKVKE